VRRDGMKVDQMAGKRAVTMVDWSVGRSVILTAGTSDGY